MHLYISLSLCLNELKRINGKDTTINGGNGVGKSRKTATHDVPPGIRFCCWRRKETRVGAVSLVTEEGEIMKRKG